MHSVALCLAPRCLLHIYLSDIWMVFHIALSQIISGSDKKENESKNSSSPCWFHVTRAHFQRFLPIAWADMILQGVCLCTSCLTAGQPSTCSEVPVGLVQALRRPNAHPCGSWWTSSQQAPPTVPQTQPQNWWGYQLENCRIQMIPQEGNQHLLDTKF